MRAVDLYRLTGLKPKQTSKPSENKKQTKIPLFTYQLEEFLDWVPLLLVVFLHFLADGGSLLLFGVCSCETLCELFLQLRAVRLHVWVVSLVLSQVVVQCSGETEARSLTVLCRLSTAELTHLRWYLSRTSFVSDRDWYTLES